jgi:superfamily II DNA or RNA helicase
MSTSAGTTNSGEARAVLLHIAGRRTLPIPADLIVDGVLALPGPWDWPVQLAALEAVLRRLASVSSEELGVVAAPRGSPWGRYRVERGAVNRPLPYDIRLWSVSPLGGACTCADFLRGALGICKHLAAVLTHLAERPRVFRRVRATPPRVRRGVVWDPVDLVATDAHDPLLGLGFVPAATASGKKSGMKVETKVGRLVEELFGVESRPSASSPWRLRAIHAADPEARLGLIQSLQGLLRVMGKGDDPAARVVLAEEGATAERLVRLRAAAPALGRAIGGITRRRRLYPYQREGVGRFLERGRLVLADDMGLGKTTQAVVVASALYDANLVRRGLFVVPAALKPQWAREWEAISRAPLRLLEGGAEERRAVYASTRRGFLLTNYEQVVKDLDAIVTWCPDFAALDEAQRIKNWATKTAIAIKRLRPEFRLVLTGTPLENRLEELASVVEWVDDRVLEPKWRLVPWHTAYADGHREVVGARNLGSLRARLGPVLLRRVRSEVLTQLPARQDTVIPVELTDRQRDAHDGLNQPIARLASVAQRRALRPPEFVQLMSLLANQRMIANGLALEGFSDIWPGIKGRSPTPAVLESLDAPKLVELRELVSSLVLSQGRKVVVFSQWRRMLELAAWAVADLLLGAGRRALFFTGQEGARRRTQNLVDFHDDPAAAVLFLTDAGGVGLNLQKAASACINLELPWNPAVLEQRVGRIHRLGQSRPIDVYNLMSQGCIEERVSSLVAGKRALFDGLFDGTSDELRFDSGRGIAQVLERLVPSAGPPASSSPAARELVEPDVDEPEIRDRGQECGTDPVPASADSAGPTDMAGLPPSPPAEAGEVGTVDETGTAPLDGPVAGTEPAIARLFGALAVQHRADGSLVIEAPPDAARALEVLFEGMARLMATARSGTGSPPVRAR